MQRFDAYQGQLVQSVEVDAWFDGAEAADQALAGAIGLSGLAQNGSVTEKAGTPNLSVDLAGPVVAYDSSGNRMAIGAATTNIPVTLDENSSSTTVVTVGHERYLSLFVSFVRNLTDPRLDALGDTVFYNRAESYELKLAMGATAVIGTASRPALRPGSVLLCDIKLVFGQTSVLNANIFTDRTQYVFNITGAPKTARARTAAATMQLLEDQINDIINGVVTIAASSVNYGGGAAWLDGLTNPAASVEAQLDKIITDLSDVTGTTSSGASRIGFAPEGTIAANNVQAALKELSDEKAATADLTAGSITIPATAISYAGGAAWLDGLTNPSTTVELQLDKVITDLSDQTGTTSSGASRIGFAPEGTIAASNVQAALKELSDEKAGLNTAVNFTSITTTSAAVTRIVSLNSANSGDFNVSGTLDWRCTGDAWHSTVVNNGVGKLMYPLSPELNNGDVLNSASVRVIPGAARAAVGGRIRVKVFRHSLTGTSVQLGSTATDDGTTNAQTVPVPLTDTVDKVQYAYYLELTSGNTANQDIVTNADVTVARTTLS